MSNWTSNFGIKQISSFSFCTYGIFYEDFPCLNVSRIPLAAQKQSPTTPFFVWPQFLHHSSRHVAFDIPSLFFGVSFLFLIWLLFLIYPDVIHVNCEFSWMCLNSCLFFADDSCETRKFMNSGKTYPLGNYPGKDNEWFKLPSSFAFYCW